MASKGYDGGRGCFEAPPNQVWGRTLHEGTYA